MEETNDPTIKMTYICDRCDNINIIEIKPNPAVCTLFTMRNYMNSYKYCTKCIEIYQVDTKTSITSIKVDINGLDNIKSVLLWL